MPQIFEFAFIYIIVTIDNALFAGMFIPVTSRDVKMQVVSIVGVLMGLSEILLAILVDYLLHNPFIHIIIILVLIWMAIYTVIHTPRLSRAFSKTSVICNVFMLTVIGNFDNMIWLGAEFRGSRLFLILFSLLTVPVFIAVSIFLSEQWQKHQWILFIGAGMMAWAAATLILELSLLSIIKPYGPAWLLKSLFTLFIVAVGFLCRRRRA